MCSYDYSGRNRPPRFCSTSSAKLCAFGPGQTEIGGTANGRWCQGPSHPHRRTTFCRTSSSMRGSTYATSPPSASERRALSAADPVGQNAWVFDVSTWSPERNLKTAECEGAAKQLNHFGFWQWVPNGISEQPQRKPPHRDCFWLCADRVRCTASRQKLRDSWASAG